MSNDFDKPPEGEEPERPQAEGGGVFPHVPRRGEDRPDEISHKGQRGAGPGSDRRERVGTRHRRQIDLEERWRRTNWPWWRRLWLFLAVAPLAFAVGSYISDWPQEISEVTLAQVGLVGLFFTCLALNSPLHPLRGDTVLAVLLAGVYVFDLDGTLEYLAGRRAFVHPDGLEQVRAFWMGWLFFVVAAIGLLVLKGFACLVRLRLAEFVLRLLLLGAVVAAFIYGPLEVRPEQDEFLAGLKEAVAEKVDLQAVQQWVSGEAPRLVQEGHLPRTGASRGPLGWLTPDQHRVYLVPEDYLKPELQPLKQDDDATIAYDAQTGRAYAGLMYGAGRMRWGVLVGGADQNVPQPLAAAQDIAVEEVLPGAYVWRMPISEERGSAVER